MARVYLKKGDRVRIIRDPQCEEPDYDPDYTNMEGVIEHHYYRKGLAKLPRYDTEWPYCVKVRFPANPRYPFEEPVEWFRKQDLLKLSTLTEKETRIMDWRVK